MPTEQEYADTIFKFILYIFIGLIREYWPYIIIFICTAISIVIARNKARRKVEPLERLEDYQGAHNLYTPNEQEEERLVGLIKLEDPDFDKELFEKFVEDIFSKFEKAYCDNKLDNLRKYVDINIIEKYKIKISQKNVIEQKDYIEILKYNFVDFFGYHKEGGNEIISVAVGVILHEFTKDREGTLVDGSDKEPQRRTFLLSFARTIGGKTINNIKNYEEGIAHCPNCGAEITNSYSECEHCGTTLFNSTENWLLNHIETI